MGAILKIAIMTLLMLLTCSLVQAQVCMSGPDLVKGSDAYKRVLAGSEKKEDVSQAFLFLGYVMGVADAGFLESNSLFKVPQNAVKGQLCAVVGKYLENHPEYWNNPIASILVEAALIEAFPDINARK